MRGSVAPIGGVRGAIEWEKVPVKRPPQSLVVAAIGRGN